MNGSFDATTVVFAVLAIFVIWKLRSVLGTRTGNERPPTNPFAPRDVTPRDGSPTPRGPGETGRVIPLPGAAERANDNGRTAASPDRWRGFAEPNSPVAAGLDEISRADRAFAPGPFLEGARIAYESVILAFAKGDKQALQPLLARDVLDGFSAEIDRRQAAGEEVETTFVGIDKATIEDAQMRGRTEQLTIRFLAKLITVTRNRAGEVIDGNADHVADIVDLWTFARAADSRDPNWQLVATENGQ